MYPYQAPLPRDHPEALGHWLEVITSMPTKEYHVQLVPGEQNLHSDHLWLPTKLKPPKNMKRNTL